MSTYLAAELRQHCWKPMIIAAYCQTTQAKSGYPMVVDHIIPSGKGGSTEFNNLCFAPSVQ
jgi:hypothetical protein